MIEQRANTPKNPQMAIGKKVSAPVEIQKIEKKNRIINYSNLKYKGFVSSKYYNSPQSNAYIE